ncbi:bactofilin family protein [Falsiroseomonas sp. HC035]|uniref:bactofilin family protein n=1 Tax=Falsiroseomonas sp. HC035 TaxID=3390999 RepID=UPI003D3144CE
MSLAPKPPTPTMPTPPAGTAIPPRPPQMGGQMGGPMGNPMGNPQGPMPGAPTMPTPRPAAPERRTLVVGRGISLQGTVADAERLVVEGTVESQMIQATELSISQTGVFKGEVQVEDAEIAGTFDGTLTARGQLVIRGTGRVIGVARCRRLMVEDGGQISGKMEMLGDAQVAPGPAPRAYAEG